jgi:probable rRNA maturation factor
MKIVLDLHDPYKAIRKVEFVWLIRKTLKVLGKRENVRVSLAVVSDEEIKDINKRYRQVNEITDVLSFPFVADDKRDDFVLPVNNFVNLGEIFISYPRARRQAQKRRRSATLELEHLFVHGLLHLFGYSHETAMKEKIMKRLEKEIIKMQIDANKIKKITAEF